MQKKQMMHLKIIAVLIFIFSFSFSGCRQEPEDVIETDPVQVETLIVEKEELLIPVNATGILASKTQSNLSFMTGGIIEKIFFDDGAVVERGELLARLDLTNINSRVEQALLALEKAKRDFRRAENLYQDSVATLEQYQNAKTALEMARSSVKMARFNRKFSEIVAPSDGKILKKTAAENEVIASGYPVLVFASTETDWVLRVKLSDRDIVQLNHGDSAKVVFDAYPGKEYSALVYELSNAADLQSGTYETELKLLETPERLVSGLVGKANIFPRKISAIIIPSSAILDASGMEGYVYRIKDGKTFRQKIEIHSVSDSGIIIKEGLNPGDTLITLGNSYLRKGDEVVVR